MPQHMRISPDGTTFYAADMMADGVFKIDSRRFNIIGFISTGIGAHGLYPGRAGIRLYVTYRGSHLVTVPRTALAAYRLSTSIPSASNEHGPFREAEAPIWAMRAPTESIYGFRGALMMSPMLSTQDPATCRRSLSEWNRMALLCGRSRVDIRSVTPAICVKPSTACRSHPRRNCAAWMDCD